MKQTTVSLIVGVLGLLLYGGCALKKGKKLKPNSLLSFGLWCGAAVAGGYMLLSALHLLQADEETYRYYVGIFGFVLMLWSLQTVADMFKAVLSKRESQTKEVKAPDATGS